MTKNINIVVFDFDGTLIKGDSIKLYCKWLSSNCVEFIFNYHIRLRVINFVRRTVDLKHERVKFYYERQMKQSFDINEFGQILKENLFDDVLEVLETDGMNNELYIVSASFSEIIDTFCTGFLKVNVITNNIEDYNALNDINHKNKVIALNDNIKTNYRITVGYGNSSGDFDFMSISKKAYLRLKNGKKVIWRQ